jgi:sterol 3beta-glucosyltransferase
MTRRITLLTSGTRGDLQPFLALGQGLQRAGYPVAVATHPPFAPLVAASGLNFVPVAGNPSDLLQAPGGQAALTWQGRPLRSLLATWRYLQDAQAVYAQLLTSAWHACQGSRALIVSLPTLWGTQIAERLDIPCAAGLLQPVSRTSAFPTPFQPWQMSLGGWYNRLSHHLIEQAMWQPWRRVINRWRRQVLGLPALPPAGPYADLYARQVLFLYGFSAHVVPRPADWPARHQICGYWSGAASAAGPPALQQFLAAGPPPVYVGFGSMGNRAAGDTPALVRTALLQAGQRGILQTDAAPTGPDPAFPGLFRPASVAHDWLFPQVAAVVHHGGAGTTAAGLRAGVPTATVPVGIDQFFWGRRLAALGVGLPPLPRHTLTVEQLAVAIRQLVGDAALRRQAAGLGQLVRTEQGVQTAIALLERYAGPLP